MRRSLVLRISSALEQQDPFIQQKLNAARQMGLSTIQKVTATLLQLAYSSPADTVDESTCTGWSTTNECIRRY
jgi:hypothetical protein